MIYTYGQKKARVIAFYLPQFHPIPENDAWWGKGFTEWTNVGKAKPLFKGHYQPCVPADLGYYDLRLPEVREQQAELAREAGIEGFCYWHYWFDTGKRLLDRPFREVLESGKPDFPFCLGWANHNWTNKSWDNVEGKVKDSVLMEQKYGYQSYIDHFHDVLPAFKDYRYITVDGKPLFVVFNPLEIPDAKEFIDLWNKLAIENGLKGVHFVGIMSNLSGYKIDENGNKKYYFVNSSESSQSRYESVLNMGFDAVNSRGLFRAELIAKGRIKKLIHNSMRNYLGFNFVDKYDYEKIIENLYVSEDAWKTVYPTLLPNWDRSPRSGKKAVIYHNSHPEAFKKSIDIALEKIQDKPDEHKILFLMSWNEWAEGNYVEPDLTHGKGYLDALKETLH